MAEVSKSGTMDRHTMKNGKKEKNTVTVFNMTVIINTKDTGKTVNDVALEHKYGRMDRNILENGRIILLKEKVSILGVMEGHMMDNGLTIRCIVEGCILGLMERHIMENILKIIGKGKEFITCLVEIL